SVCVSPDGDVFVSTSNRDWNPNAVAKENDDRIIRIFRLDKKDAEKNAPSAVIVGQEKDTVDQGKLLYMSYCASCHKADGSGMDGYFPALDGAPFVRGDKDSLIRIVLAGRNEMPQF